MAKSKRYRAVVDQTGDRRELNVIDAIKVVKKSSTAKFDETIECHMHVNIKGNQTVRDTTILPHGFQKEQKILVFARGDKAAEAEAAGAAFVGAEDMVAKVQKGWVDFDVAIATPDMMREVGKLGPVLGRRGLMPNPKTRTVTNDLAEAIAEVKKGRIEFRADKSGVIHVAVGKASMESGALVENLEFMVNEIIKQRPADLKGEFVSSIFLSPTMGPSVKVLNDE